MFAQAYSMSTFLKGVRYYLEIRCVFFDLNHISGSNEIIFSSFSDVSEEDLFVGIEIATTEDGVPLPADVRTLMSSWTRQSGYPIVEVTRNYNATANNVTFSQRRFMTEATATPDNSTFRVPLFIGLPTDAEDGLGFHSIQWLSNNSEESLQITNLTSADWLIVNKFSSGFYRVLYDRQNYRLIANALTEDFHLFSVADRSSFIDDIYTLAENDLVSYDVFFDHIRYMESEHYYEVWYTATQALTVILRKFEGQNSNDHLRVSIILYIPKVNDKTTSNRLCYRDS